MKDTVFEASQTVPANIDQVFEFFSDANNLGRITPPWLNFQVLGMTTPTVQTGALINYKLRFRGFPIRWQTRIDEWQPKERFVDSQVIGPFSKWHHTHLFEPTDGGVKVRDIVRYRVPLGKIGALFSGPFVAMDVKRIFEYRTKIISEIFGAK